MSWTALLHPRIIGEAASLPRESRIRFLTGMMRQDSKGPLSPSLDYLTPVQSGYRYSLHRRFYKLDDFVFCFETKIFDNNFCYLFAAPYDEDRDEDWLKTAQARAVDITEKRVEPVELIDYFHSLPRDEYLEALDIIAIESTRKMHLAILREAHLKARAETAAFFNYSKPHMEAFEKRLDYYLNILNRHLENHEGGLRLHLEFKGGSIFTASSFGDVLKLE